MKYKRIADYNKFNFDNLLAIMKKLENRVSEELNEKKRVDGEIIDFFGKLVDYQETLNLAIKESSRQQESRLNQNLLSLKQELLKNTQELRKSLTDSTSYLKQELLKNTQELRKSLTDSTSYLKQELSKSLAESTDNKAALKKIEGIVNKIEINIDQKIKEQGKSFEIKIKELSKRIGYLPDDFSTVQDNLFRAQLRKHTDIMIDYIDRNLKKQTKSINSKAVKKTKSKK
jgi:hypothetical protein